MRRLNDLDAKSWVKHTRSWLVVRPPKRRHGEMLHPAKFPEALAAEFIEFFTSKGEVVFDPFLGTGSTLVAARALGRRGVGMELLKKYADVARERLECSREHEVIVGDARNARDVLPEALDRLGASSIDFMFTSPPYWNMLRNSRGNNETAQKRRASKGLDTYYSEEEADLGNEVEHRKYLDGVSCIISSIKPFLREGAYLGIVVQNVRPREGEMVPIAWELAMMLRKDYKMRQERIWVQDDKPLGCWGYPTTYVANVHHHYCLIFQK